MQVLQSEGKKKISVVLQYVDQRQIETARMLYKKAEKKQLTESDMKTIDWLFSKYTRP